MTDRCDSPPDELVMKLVLAAKSKRDLQEVKLFILVDKIHKQLQGNPSNFLNASAQQQQLVFNIALLRNTLIHNQKWGNRRHDDVGPALRNLVLTFAGAVGDIDSSSSKAFEDYDADEDEDCSSDDDDDDDDDDDNDDDNDDENDAGDDEDGDEDDSDRSRNGLDED
jgi:hypothetical protein